MPAVDAPYTYPAKPYKKLIPQNLGTMYRFCGMILIHFGPYRVINRVVDTVPRKTRNYSLMNWPIIPLNQDKWNIAYCPK